MTTTPEEAWQALIDQCVVCKGSDDGSHNDEKPAFMFAYRRALEDAADDRGLRIKFPDSWGPLRIWLRDLAAAFGAKDGADDE